MRFTPSPPTLERQPDRRLRDVPGTRSGVAATRCLRLRRRVEDERNTILIVGFMAQHTLGRRLVERRPRVKIWGVERDLLARVEILNAFSAHADRDDLIAHVNACSPVRRVFLVHGESDQQEPQVTDCHSRSRPVRHHRDVSKRATSPLRTT